MSDAADLPEPDTSFRALLGQRDFVLFWLSRFVAVLGVQVQGVALGWHIYAVARDVEGMDVKRAALVVSLIGLVSFLPVLLLALPAGETADRHDRRRILLRCYLAEIVVAAGLATVTFLGWASIPVLLGAAALFGAARSYFSPASTALGRRRRRAPRLCRSIATTPGAHTGARRGTRPGVCWRPLRRQCRSGRSHPLAAGSAQSHN